MKEIAKACGVTQKSLLDAMPKTGSRTSSSSRTGASSKTGSSSRTSTAAKSSMQVTATERRLVELYREADSETKRKALALLRGTEDDGIADDILQGIGGIIGDMLFKKQ